MEKLKRLREGRGLSQVKLAARADLNPATVNQIERGMRDASPGTLRKLADALEVSLYELLEEESPKAQAPLPLDDAGEREISYEEAAGSTPEERVERADALARVIQSIASTYRDSLVLMSDAPAGELFGLYMQASLTHVGAQHLAESEGYAGLTPEGHLEAALDKLGLAAEEIEQAMTAAEAQEDLPDGVAWLAAHQRRRAG